MGAVDACVGRLFCIFCIRERFRASNRFKNTDEWVLNFRHCTSDNFLLSESYL